MLAVSIPAKLKTSHWYWPPTLSSLVRYSCCVVETASPVLRYLHKNSFLGPPWAVHVNCTASPSKEFSSDGVTEMLPLGETEKIEDFKEKKNNTDWKKKKQREIKKPNRNKKADIQSRI